MKLSGKVITVVSVIVVAAFALVLIPRGETPAKEDAPKAATAKQAKKDRAAKRIEARKKLAEKKSAKTDISATQGKKKNQAKADKPKLRRRLRPLMVEEDLSHLTVEQRADVKTIQTALDNNDFNSVLAVTQKMQQSKDWPDKIPIELRKEALNSLSWFGIKALPEVTGFLADAEPEIVEEAVTAYENLISDANGDSELQQIVLAASYTVNDAGSMESIMMELNNMRPSVAVSTIKAVWESGTEAAKAALPDAIEFLTGEENITTPEALDEWYNDPSGDNMDGEDAEEEFGPKPENESE